MARGRSSSGNRPQRVAEVMREVLATEIMGGLKDPDVGMVTVTGVVVAKDMRHAKVYVTVMGDDQDIQRSLAALRRAAGYLRGEVTRELQMKFAPELEFKFDTAVSNGAKVDDLIRLARERDLELARLRGDTDPLAPAPAAPEPLKE